MDCLCCRLRNISSEGMRRIQGCHASDSAIFRLCLAFNQYPQHETPMKLSRIGQVLISNQRLNVAEENREMRCMGGIGNPTVVRTSGKQECSHLSHKKTSKVCAKFAKLVVIIIFTVGYHPFRCSSLFMWPKLPITNVID